MDRFNEKSSSLRLLFGFQFDRTGLNYRAPHHREATDDLLPKVLSFKDLCLNLQDYHEYHRPL